MKTNKVVKTQETQSVEIDAKDIIEMLRQKGIDVPNNAAVTFEVPTGGDYSGMTLDVDGECPVTIKWTKES